MSRKSGEHNQTVIQLLKCIQNLVNIPNSNVVVDFAISKIKQTTVEENNHARKHLCTIIIDEVCSYFQITNNDLRQGKKYKFNIPRLIMYYLFYFHTNMLIVEIAVFFGKSDDWVERKIKEFKSLNPEVIPDKKILDAYDKIFNRVICRIAELQKELQNTTQN